MNTAKSLVYGARSTDAGGLGKADASPIPAEIPDRAQQIAKEAAADLSRLDPEILRKSGGRGLRDVRRTQLLASDLM
ncbi:hypothetical protein [Rhodococcus qingshengii]|uniref:hypothetical protein n=1 Tax=Rhodococcus qingshengii TaxID=334542 RepID=UPI0009F1B246|nr:hypothetical protein [Rhodococcus qingshengii]MDT9662330.1 hypothetical protein [Rhodococcus qingshengii]ORC22454.1 hypothetical protein BXO91_19635 [Rhodococcus qingshengii]QOS60901.1 hypothetical protein IM699_15830 [Rhodococcus qingshengii]